MQPHIKVATPHSVFIHIAGDYARAKEACQDFCDQLGLCVTVTATEYVYTGGSEAGVRVGLINYPRFPKDADEIEETAYKLAATLRNKLDQDSFTIETPNSMAWFSWREQDVQQRAA